MLPKSKSLQNKSSTVGLYLVSNFLNKNRFKIEVFLRGSSVQLVGYLVGWLVGCHLEEVGVTDTKGEKIRRLVSCVFTCLSNGS